MLSEELFLHEAILVRQLGGLEILPGPCQHDGDWSQLKSCDGVDAKGGNCGDLARLSIKQKVHC